jgi:hypothetical protein
MNNYYCQVAGLQDIHLDAGKLTHDAVSLREGLKDELQIDDNQLITILFLPFDNANLLALLKKDEKELDPRGNFSRDTLENQIKFPDELPAYMSTFIFNFKQKHRVYSHLSLENELTALFYQEMLKSSNPLIREYFELDLNTRNLYAALNCRKFKLDPESEIIPANELAEKFQFSTARDFGLQNEFPYLEELINYFNIPDSLEREKSIDLFRWKFLDEHTFFNYFTIEKIISHIIKLQMVERWMSLDPTTGKELFSRLVDGLKDGFAMPVGFNS